MGSIIVSFAVLFVQPLFRLIGLAFSSMGLYIANKTGRELKLQTLRQVAEKMTREHYREIRRNPNTINRKEIECILLDWLSNELVLSQTNRRIEYSNLPRSNNNKNKNLVT